MTQDARITISNGKLNVPDHPVIPFIEGDGTGPGYLARERARLRCGRGEGLRRQAADRMEGSARRAESRSSRSTTGCRMKRSRRFANYLVGIKGPLTTPVGGGIRSLNVALRQMLDLYVCLRPVRYFHGRAVAGEAAGKSRHGDLPREHRRHLRRHRIRRRARPKRRRCSTSSRRNFRKEFEKIRFGTQGGESTSWQKQLESIGAPKRDVDVEVGIGFKPVSYLGTERLVHSAIGYAIEHKRKSVTLVHKGNIMKFTEGGFRDWGYKVAKDFFGAVEIDGGPWCKIPDGKPGAGIVIKDVDRRHHAAAGAHAAGRFRRHRHAEPQRRLPQRRAGRAGRRHRHRAGRQHQLRHRPRHLRSHARHRAEVRRTRTR